MSVEAVSELVKLSAALGDVRSRVNRSHRHHTLIRTRMDAYNTICSAMDAVGDTCWALSSYSEREPLPDGDKGAAYLLVYGVLQTLYLQQDAVFWLCHCLEATSVMRYSDPGSWARSLPALERARSARNDSTGHPVRRTQPALSAFFISQITLSATGFELFEVSANKRSTFRHVSLPILVLDQVRVLTTVLKECCRELDSADEDHYRRFMDQPLTPILMKLDYWVGKLGSKEGSDGPMISPAVKAIRSGLGQLRAAVVARDEPFENFLDFEFRKLMRALKWLRDYANDAANDDHDMAWVLADFVRYGMKEMGEATKQIDEHYATAAKPPARTDPDDHAAS